MTESTPPNPSTTPSPSTKASNSRWGRTLMVLVALAILGGVLGFLSGQWLRDGVTDATSREAVPSVSQLSRAVPEVLPDFTLGTLEGPPRSLSSFEYDSLIVNFWATWCAPCREEMPSLEALQRQFGSDQFEVVTLATGRNSPQAIRRFFEEIGVENLSMYRDINQQIARQMSVMGLPITLVIDPQGREIARLMGDAHWDSPEAFAFFEALLAESS